MAGPDSKSICENCKYWEYTGHAGECRRYPKPVVKYQTQWCGEFALSPVVVESAFIALPVIDIPQIEEKRKPGRPKKENV